MLSVKLWEYFWEVPREMKSVLGLQPATPLASLELRRVSPLAAVNRKI